MSHEQQPKVSFIDLTARHVPGRGWLPLLIADREGKRRELFRGRYYPTFPEAVHAVAHAHEQIQKEGVL